MHGGGVRVERKKRVTEREGGKEGKGGEALRKGWRGRGREGAWDRIE